MINKHTNGNRAGRSLADVEPPVELWSLAAPVQRPTSDPKPGSSAIEAAPVSYSKASNLGRGGRVLLLLTFPVNCLHLVKIIFAMQRFNYFDLEFSSAQMEKLLVTLF